jgi:HPt (histidine-containing phosphotransfer) domain-containing protein
VNASCAELISPTIKVTTHDTAATASAGRSTVPAPVSDAELIDMERLLEFSGGSRTSLIEITDLYFGQTTEQLARLETAVQQHNAPEVASVAHSSAGASGVCGIVIMETLFRRAERFAKDKRVTDAGALLPEMHENFARVKALLLNSRQNLPLS